MVFMIIIPMKNGYFIGNIPWSDEPTSSTPWVWKRRWSMRATGPSCRWSWQTEDGTSCAWWASYARCHSRWLHNCVGFVCGFSVLLPSFTISYHLISAFQALFIFNSASICCLCCGAFCCILLSVLWCKTLVPESQSLAFLAMTGQALLPLRNHKHNIVILK